MGEIHLVDDDAGVRKSVSFLLRVAGYRARVYESAPQFLSNMPRDMSGCLVTDVRMPEMDGISLIGELRRRGLNIPAIVITGHGDVPLAVKAMRAGALDFIEKPFEDEAFLGAVSRALAAPRASADVAAESRATLTCLSSREKQVLDCLMNGLSQKEIARHLEISPRTVEAHRNNIAAKTGATRLSDMVRLAVLASV